MSSLLLLLCLFSVKVSNNTLLAFLLLLYTNSKERWHGKLNRSAQSSIMALEEDASVASMSFPQRFVILTCSWVNSHFIMDFKYLFSRCSQTLETKNKKMFILPHKHLEIFTLRQRENMKNSNSGTMKKVIPMCAHSTFLNYKF